MTGALFGDNPDYLCPHCGVVEANDYVFNLNHRQVPGGGCTKQELLLAHTKAPNLSGEEHINRVQIAKEHRVKTQQEVTHD